MPLTQSPLARLPRRLVILLSIVGFFSFPSQVIARVFYAKNGAPTYWNGAAEHRVYVSLWKYIGTKFRADYFYKGKLVNQVGAGLEVPGMPKSIETGIYLVHGFRYQDGSAQSAIIVTKSGRVLLAAIGRELYQCATTVGSKPLMAVFVRNPKNLRYLPALKTWASSFCGHYVIHLYNLNCKHQGRHPLITSCPLNRKH
ncbi:MAG: hypothetical protein ACYDEV_05430 [Acidiferrobacter sp.]